ncbi:MAG: YybH family protein [Pyrinomonadaceae bacterium]
MRYIIVIFLALASLSHSAYAQRQTSSQNRTSRADSDSLAVQKAAEEFIKAFNNLEWGKFRNSFSDDVTVFFPFNQDPRRANGRAEVETSFKSGFDELRKRKPNPPYLNIQPKDVQIQMLKDTAILTFHLPGEDTFGRRTLVFQKQKGKWLIVHLHASIISKPK